MIWLAIVALLGTLVYVLAPVLTPFASAALFAYLGNPLVARLVAAGLPRSIAIALAFSVLVLAVVLLILVALPLLESQLGILVQRWPLYVEWLQGSVLPWLQRHFGTAVTIDSDLLREMLATHWQQFGGIGATVFATIGKSLASMAAWFANLLIVPVVTFYLMRDWEKLLAMLRALLPRSNEALVVSLLGECNAVLGTFMRGQLLVMVALAVFYAAGLWFTGLELALLIGVVAGLVSFVPYLGVIVGLGSAVLAAWLQTHDLALLLPVLLVFAAGQVLESFVLTPLLVGESIGLHPVAVIFAVMAGGELFGFIGVLLALPVAAVCVVMLRHVHRSYVDSSFYGSAAEDDSQS